MQNRIIKFFSYKSENGFLFRKLVGDIIFILYIVVNANWSRTYNLLQSLGDMGERLMIIFLCSPILCPLIYLSMQTGYVRTIRFSLGAALCAYMFYITRGVS